MINPLLDKITNQMNFSGVIHLKHEQKVIYEKAFGLANRAEQLPNTIDTRFGMASGCKLFTAIGICQLIEQGHLSLQSKAAEILDVQFPNFDKEVTVHQLLTHTSGIPDYFDEEVMEDFAELWTERPVYHMRNLDDFLPMFQTKGMVHQPGEKFHYNNAGYIILGLLIEQVTERRFTDYIETEIFNTSKMKRSGYFSMDQLPDQTALGYIDNAEEHSWKTNIFSVPAKGGADGGAFITAPDMMNFWESFMSNQLLSSEMTRSLINPHVHVKNEMNYGLGLWINSRKGRIFKYHVMGYDPGVSFRSAFYPESNIKVVVTSNKESGPYEIIEALEQYLEV